MAQVRKDGETWTLVLVKHLRHPPEKVWRALTEPAHLREWAPFDASGDLGNAGTVTVTWVGSTIPPSARVEVVQFRADHAVLGTIPHGVWLGMSIVELLCVVGLMVPAISSDWLS